MFVNLFVEKPFTTTFDRLAISLVFVDIRTNGMIEAGFAGLFGVKSLVCIEECTLDIEPQAFDELESILQVGLQIVGVIVIARKQTCRSNDEPLAICNWQDVRCFTFLGQHMTAIQIEF